MTEPELSPLLRSLSQAVEDCPDDLPLRVHLAEQLLGAGLPAEALRQVSVALGLAPGDAGVLAVLARATAALQAPVADTEPRQTQQPQAASGQEFDWHAAESELTGVEGILPPPFLDEAAGDQTGGPSQSDPDVQRAGITLADVAGMEHVKERLELAFLTPMRNPELREMYGASMRGGLLLYGPPGCGKTYLARALAGELGAQFLVVGLAEVLDMWIGASEKNLHEVFETARRHAPCVLFLDEVDAIGQKRSQLRGSSMRGTVNQLLTELDGAGSNNDGVFVLAATNHPWDVDPALKRPGRLDRSVLVLPPDQSAREAILRTQLRSKPLSGITVAPIAKATDGWSGADLGALVERAAQRALSDSVRSGQARPVEQRDLEGSLKELGPSIGPWYETAKSVAQFANSSGEYDELLAHLKSRRLL